MNTPTHVVFSALALDRGRWRAHWLAITAGAVAPDLSMVCLYVYERVIWEPRYFDRDWQFVVDLFNSFPLIGVAALIAWRLRSTAWLAFCASMALHCVTDLLVHREDAHAHFLPVSSWRGSRTRSLTFSGRRARSSPRAGHWLQPWCPFKMGFPDTTVATPCARLTSWAR
jgi:hypothetical protein